MDLFVQRAARAFWAALLEAIFPGAGHLRNGHVWRACWDTVGFLSLAIVLFSFAGISFALFASLCLLIMGWRMVHFLWAGVDGWKSPITPFPWFRTAPLLLVVSLVCSGLLVYGLKAPLRYRLFRLPSGSMQPTVLVGDRFVVDMDWYQHQKLQRGDVIAFANPQDDGEMILKRCVALPGDRVECRGSELFVNGKEMTFISGDVAAKVPLPESEGEYSGPLTLAEGTFYCLGDDRTNSLDSRILGPVPVNNLRGKALYLVIHGGHLVMGRDL